MREKKGNIYSRLAFTGILKNYRMYVPYLLTCTGMVMICYILHFLMRSGHVTMMKGGSTLQTMLLMGGNVFQIFAAIFLFYTNSFLIRSRKREFGLYNILGMGKRNLARILLWETVIVAVASLTAGIFCGVLFSKLAELVIAAVLHSETTMAFSVDVYVIGGTVRLFLIIFLLLLLNALFQVGKAKPVDLLHSGEVGEKPPKANWFLALVGFAMLAAAYYIAATIKEPTSALVLFFAAVALVIVATYAIFIAGSVLLCRLLQKNKSYYYRPNHFISVSSMAYRMKRSGAGLASICVLSTMVLVMFSAASCLYFGSEARLLERYVRELEVYTYSADDAYMRQIAEAVGEAAPQAGIEHVLSYRYLSTSVLLADDQIYMSDKKMTEAVSALDVASMWDVSFIPIADYNTVMGTNETLADDEVLLYYPKGGSYEYETLTVEGCGTWNVKGQVSSFTKNGEDTASVFNTLCVFVPELSDLARIQEAQKSQHTAGYSQMTSYYGFDISGDDAQQLETAKRLGEAIDARRNADESFPSVYWDCRAEEKDDFYALFGGLFVVGIVLGIVFLAAMVLIMYYKQITEGLEDQARFEIMQKVGMTDREIRRSIRSQMLTVFLMPLLLAGVHTGFAFPIVSKLLILFGVTDSKVLLWTNVVCYLVFTLFYVAVYLVTSRSYYKIVRGARA